MKKWLSLFLLLTVVTLAFPAWAQDNSSESAGNSFFPAVQAYYGTQLIAQKIAERVDRLEPSGNYSVLVTGAGDSFPLIYAYYKAYKEIIHRLTSLAAQYKDLENTPVSQQPKVFSALLTDLSSTVSVINDLAALFKISMQTTEAKVQLDTTAFVAQLLSELENLKITAAYDRFPPLDEKFFDLYTQCLNLKSRLNGNDKVDSNKLAALNQEFEKVQAMLYDPNAIMNLQIGAMYQKFFDNTQGNRQYLLNLKVIQGGGTTRITSGFLYSGSTAYAGGAVVSFFLSDQNGKILDTGTLINYQGYQRAMDENGRIPKLNP